MDYVSVTLARTAYVYNGSPKRPQITVTDQGRSLTAGTDYAVSYQNDTNAGTASAIVTGRGNYTGTLSVPYTIEKADQEVLVPKTLYQVDLGTKRISLRAVSSGDGALSYRSGRPSTASVSAAGVVTIKAAGTAVITITAAETANYFGAEEDVIVMVTPKKAKIKSAKSTKTKQMKITWKKDASASGYQILMATDRKFKKNKKVVNVNKKKATSTTVKKLKAKSFYYIKMRTYTTVNGNKVYGPYSNMVKKKTK